jgi:ribosome-binding protein aMBF1 (putative translation factor)
MSLKWVVFALAVGGGAYAVARAEPPAPPGAVAGEPTQVTMREKLRYSVGSVGVAIVGSSVRRSVVETEQTLKDMKVTIKNARGADGTRARDVAKKIHYMDSVAVEQLEQGRPIQAMKMSMEAKSLLSAVRSRLTRGV